MAVHALVESLFGTMPIFIGGVVFGRPSWRMRSSLRLTLSAGMAVREPHEPFDTVYSEADEALYAAKRSGRNCIELLPGVKRAIEAGQARFNNGYAPVR